MKMAPSYCLGHFDLHPLLPGTGSVIPGYSFLGLLILFKEAKMDASEHHEDVGE
jgi:hypothetical protein